MEQLSDEELAQLESADLRPAMEAPSSDVQREEGFLASFDDTHLYWQSWCLPQKPRGAVALVHGFAEHSARYHHVASLLARAGYAVMAVDLRGHGRSMGIRGHVMRFEEYPRDVNVLVTECRRRWPGVPLYGLGHSNGGLVCLHHALLFPDRLQAYAVTSPFCGFKVVVPAAKAAAGRAMSKVWPTFALPTDLDPQLVSHVPEVVEKYANDPLLVDVASARWYTETTKAHRVLRDRAKEIEAPFLWLVSGGDEIADARAAEDVYHRLGSRDRELEIYPDLYHEVLNEEGWEELARDIIRWFERHRPTT